MSNLEYEEFGKYFRKMRKGKGFSIVELSTGICSTKTISRIEHGEHFPQRETLNELGRRLGEDSFYERYIMGREYELYKKRKQLKKTLLKAAELGEIGSIEEKLMELKDVIGEAGCEDMQFYLALQNIWYKMNGVSLEERSKRFIEIFEMAKKFPRPEMDLRAAVDSLKLNETDHLIVNNIGLSLMHEGKSNMAIKVLTGLYIYVYENMNQCEKKKRKLAIISSNCCIACMKALEYEKADIFCKYALTYSARTGDLKLIISALNLEVKLLKAVGKDRESQLKLKYMDELTKILTSYTEKTEVIRFTPSFEGIAVL